MITQRLAAKLTNLYASVNLRTAFYSTMIALMMQSQPAKAVVTDCHPELIDGLYENSCLEDDECLAIIDNKVKGASLGLSDLDLPPLKDKTLELGTVNNDFINIFDGLHDPNLNYFVLGLDGNDTIIGGNGRDFIKGGPGFDIIMGAVGDNLLVSGSDGGFIAGAFVQADFVISTLINPFFNLGSNTVVGGSGNDEMSGFLLFVNVDVSTNDFTNVGELVGNTLIGGSGNQTMYGQVGISVSQPFNTADLGLVKEGEDVTINGSILYGGSGTNHMVGIFGTIIKAPAGDVYYHECGYLKGNALFAGSGDGTLIGTIDTYVNRNPDATTSTGGADGDMGYSEFFTGPNLLVGGPGTNLLIGDAKLINVKQDPNKSTVIWRFGDSILIAGTGDTTMVGDVYSRAPDDTSMIFYGNDTFQFSLQNPMGNNKILDMNEGGVNDTLKFTGVKDHNKDGVINAADVDEIATYSDDGNGKLLMSVDGGSILFDNVDYTNQDSVLDVTPNVVVIGLS